MPAEYALSGKVSGTGSVSLAQEDAVQFETSVTSEALRISQAADGKVLFDDTLSARLRRVAEGGGRQ